MCNNYYGRSVSLPVVNQSDFTITGIYGESLDLVNEDGHRRFDLDLPGRMAEKIRENRAGGANTVAVTIPAFAGTEQAVAWKRSIREDGSSRTSPGPPGREDTSGPEGSATRGSLHHPKSLDIQSFTSFVTTTRIARSCEACSLGTPTEKNRRHNDER